MKGLVLAEQAHIVNVLPPVDITGGKIAQAVSMKGSAHATFIIQIGVSAAAFTKIILSVGSATAAVGSAVADAAAIAFYIYKQETAGADKDTLGARTAVAAAGYTPSAADGIFYVVEVDASEMTDALPYLQLSLTNGSNSVIASAVCILSGSRYAGDQSATQTA